MNVFLSAARVLATCYRFPTLRLSGWLFRDATSSTDVNLDLFGYSMAVKVQRSTTHRLLALIGERLIPERCLLDNLVSAGATVIDVGAKIGYYTAYFS